MDARELRIGNWIEEEYNNIRQWKLEDYRLYHGRDYLENEISDKIYPIPLSPEILEKCGFEDGELTLDHSNGNVCLSLSLTSNTVSMWVEGFYQFGKCEYLHQLQNLFYWLTGGQELPFNEQAQLLNSNQPAENNL